MNSLLCSTQRRRELVQRQLSFNGLDYLEVSQDQRLLTVYFIDKSPLEITADQVKIHGGQSIRNIQVTKVKVVRSEHLEYDDYMEVSVDKPGDFSTYTLSVTIDGEGENSRSAGRLDPYYSSLEFSFKVACPSDLDCRQDEYCPEPERVEPAINYLAKDYASFRQLLLDRLALVMPEWKERHVPDVGIALVEILAYVGDHLSYFQDAVATEAYIDTARLRTSVRRHARLVDYLMHEGCNARAWIHIDVNGHVPLNMGSMYFVTRFLDPGKSYKPALEVNDLANIAHSRYQVFEPMGSCPVNLYQDHNEIHFYTWGQQECCLESGAVEVDLYGELTDECQNDRVDDDKDGNEVQQSDDESTGQDYLQTPGGHPQLKLKSGDVLIFEEVTGPGTGNKADADPTRRHAVCLTRVEPGFDPLTRTPLVHISWSQADALPFSFCISVIGPAPECLLIENVSVARGNIIGVDHGRTVKQALGAVKTEESTECCTGEGLPADVIQQAAPFRPQLSEGPLTFCQSLLKKQPASRLCIQDPRQAVPHINLTETSSDNYSHHWRPVRDLLEASPDNRQFVAEVDENGKAVLRFGNGRSGMRPEAGSLFTGCYRIGNGKAGNVGAESINHMIMSSGLISGGIINIRNPMAASGGINPEPQSEVKLFAPKAFRTEIQRAITAEDYARLVEREFKGKVQKAAATICWTGCAYLVRVAIDPLGQEQADSELLAEVERRLYRYRRIGHSLLVQSACRVPLDIQLSVCVKPDFLRDHVKTSLLDAFSNRSYGNGLKGFFHPDKLTFGDDIYLSKLSATAQKIAGVQSVSVSRLKRCFEPANGELENGVLALAPLEIARLDNNPSLPANGKLALIMGGGR